tara:strand:+ start:142 stop:342 length:201 start_codon:yes stop_codon:yes gene_type:complete
LPGLVIGIIDININNINSALKVYCGGEKHHPSPFENQPWRNLQYPTQRRNKERKKYYYLYIYMYMY